MFFYPGSLDYVHSDCLDDYAAVVDPGLQLFPNPVFSEPRASLCGRKSKVDRALDCQTNDFINGIPWGLTAPQRTGYEKVQGLKPFGQAVKQKSADLQVSMLSTLIFWTFPSLLGASAFPNPSISGMPPLPTIFHFGQET